MMITSLLGDDMLAKLDRREFSTLETIIDRELAQHEVFRKELTGKLQTALDRMGKREKIG